MNQLLRKITELAKPFDELEVIAEIFGSSYEKAKNDQMPVVLFCAGASGGILANLFARNGIHPVGFCDNDVMRIGSHYCDLPVISFKELKVQHKESLIVIASAAYQRLIKAQLLESGFKEGHLVLLDSEDTSFDSILRRERVMMLARNGEPNLMMHDLFKNEEKLLFVYNLLGDGKSKDLFIQRLVLIASCFEYEVYKAYLSRFSEPILKMGYDNPHRLQCGGNDFYFNNDVLTLRDGEVFIDGGAFNGDSAKAFIKACEEQKVSYHKIHCFEADEMNFQELSEKMAGYSNIVCTRAGLWSHKTTLGFVSSAQTDRYCARVQGDGVTTSGAADIEIRTETIDEHLNGNRVTLIKLDIEGAELEAIKGGAESIRTFAPKLAISIYHKVSDLYEIPLLVHQLRPDYTLYLRHLGNYFDDTLLFAT